MVQQMQQLGNLSLTPHKEFKMPKLKQDRPAYMVGGKGFFNSNDKFLYPGQMTYLDGEPNQDLIPLNKVAYDEMQKFLDKLDALASEKAKREKRSFIPQPRQEWREEEILEDLPAPDFVMASKKLGADDTIR